MPLITAAVADEATRRPDGTWTIRSRRYSFKPPSFPAVLRPYVFVSYEFTRRESPEITSVSLHIFRASTGEPQWEWQVPVQEALGLTEPGAPLIMSVAERAELVVQRPERYSVDVCVNGVTVKTLPLTVHAPMPQTYSRKPY